MEELTQEDMTKMYGVMRLIVGDNRPVNKLRPALDMKSRFRDAVMFIDSIAVVVEHGGRKPFFEIARIQYASDKKIKFVLDIITEWIQSKLSPYDFLPGSTDVMPDNLKTWSRAVV